MSDFESIWICDLGKASVLVVMLLQADRQTPAFLQKDRTL